MSRYLQLQLAFTLACGQARLEQAKQLGLNVVYTTTYALPQPDFSSMALAIKNANPDAVLLCSYYPDAVGIAQALHRIGYAPKFLAETIGPAEAEFDKALGPIANGIISNTSWWASLKTPDNAGFVSRYKAMFQRGPRLSRGGDLSAMQVLGAAVKPPSRSTKRNCGTGSRATKCKRCKGSSRATPTVCRPNSASTCSRSRTTNVS